MGAEVALAGMAVGTGVGAFGAYSSGQAAKRRSEYQAAVLRNNAARAERAAQDAERRAEIRAGERGIQTRQLTGAQRAALAANNLLIDEGTALDVVMDTAALGAMDQARERDTGARQAADFRNQGQNFTSSAELAILAGADEERASYLDSLSTFSTGAGRVADRWYRFNREGAFD